MANTIQTAQFTSESEEAAWWERNQDALLGEFEHAANEGTLGHGTLVRRGQTQAITIRLDQGDVELARVQAEQRGLRYQTYLKMLIHQALTHPGQ